MKKCLNFGLSVIIFLFASIACHAAVVFSEDFESLSNGNLTGQGGWTGDTGVFVSDFGNNLPTRVLRRPPVSSGVFHQVFNTFDTTAYNGLVTFSFDAYALSQYEAHNHGLTIRSSADNSVAFHWFSDRSGNPDTWLFNGVYYPLGFDKDVTLQIVFDKQTQMVWGRYDFGAGFVDTPQYASGFTAAQLDSIDEIRYFQDSRLGRFGIEVDNITVTATAVPEPSSSILLALGLMGLTFRRRK